MQPTSSRTCATSERPASPIRGRARYDGVVRRLASASIASCVLLSVGPANANGRFPSASQLVVDPGDAQRIVLRTTFGVVQSFDGGAAWRWVCESSVGYSGTFDPAIALTGNGRLLVGLPDGLSSSSNRGCDFPRASHFDGQLVIDLVRDLAVTSTEVDGGFNVSVASTPDNGASWSTIATLPSDFDAETIEVAPARPERIYVSGTRGKSGVLEKSDDRGKTWERIAIDLGPNGIAPFLAAVDPKNPDVVYLRIDGDATKSAPDQLLVSRDGGKTWTKLAETAGDMLAFALAPDGAKLVYGGPTDGVSITSTTDPKPQKVSSIAPRCLTWASAGLYACGRQSTDGFTVGLSNDDGRTWRPLYKLPDLEPLECTPSTTTGKLCPSVWPGIELSLGVPTEDAGNPDASMVEPSPPKDGCKCALGVRGRGSLHWIAIVLYAFARRRARG